MIRKAFNIALCLILVSPFILIPYNVQAETLGDMYSELDKLRKEKADADKQSELTKDQIDETRSDIVTISKEIENNKLEIINIDKEIEVLNSKIIEKKEATKKIINFFQKAEGEKIYLEYLFGAKDLTDFIYRLANIEKISKYNTELLSKMNKMIKENEENKVRIQQQETLLASKRKILSQKVNSLGSRLEGLTEITKDIDAEIRATKNLITEYERMGCKYDQELSVCASIPLDVKFIRPTSDGRTTSGYGWRWLCLKSRGCGWNNHTGIDIGGNSAGTSVLAIANGRVANIVSKAKCGGNMLYINHTVNGKKYTSAYYHLWTVKVKVGDVVGRGDAVATVGGNKSVTPWDNCSTGTHLHFGMADGHYKGFDAFTYTYNINPKNVITFPSSW